MCAPLAVVSECIRTYLFKGLGFRVESLGFSSRSRACVRMYVYREKARARERDGEREKETFWCIYIQRPFGAYTFMCVSKCDKGELPWK